MKLEDHETTFNMITALSECLGFHFSRIEDFSNMLRISTETFDASTDNFNVRVDVSISIMPGHDNFGEHYISIERTSYYENRLHEFQAPCIDIPLTYINDDYYDKRVKRMPMLMINKESFYMMHDVLKKYQLPYVNLITILYTLRVKPK